MMKSIVQKIVGIKYICKTRAWRGWRGGAIPRATNHYGSAKLVSWPGRHPTSLYVSVLVHWNVWKPAQSCCKFPAL